MKIFKTCMTLFLALALLLGVAACDDEVAESSDTPSEESVAEVSSEMIESSETESSLTESSDEESSEPPPPPEPTAAEVFADAAAFWAEAGSYCHEIEIVSECVIGSGSYTDETERTANYIGVGTDGFCVAIDERLIHLDGVLRYSERYKDGKAYFAFEEGNVYEAETDADAYASRIMPAVILDPALYETVEFTDESKTAFRFENASAPEGWIDSDSMLFETASGTAVMSEEGIIEKMEYTVFYFLGPMARYETYTVELSESELQAEDVLPLTGKSVVTVPDIALPMILYNAELTLPTVPYGTGSVLMRLQSDALGAVFAEDLSFASIQMENGEPLLKIDDEYYLYAPDFEETQSESVTYRDGKLTYILNDEEKTNKDLTYDGLLSYVTDTLCSFVIADYESMQALEITDLGDFWVLEFDIDRQKAKSIEQFALAKILPDASALDPYISDFAVSTLEGKLSIDKDTGYLTAASYLLEADHVIEGESYRFYYSHDITFDACNIGAYYEITEEPYPDIEPPEEDKATPAFYEITDANGNKLYLLGTIHLGDDRTAFLPDEIYDALNDADALAVEMNLNTVEDRLLEDEELHKAYMESYFYQDGTKLIDKIGKELYEDARKRMFACGWGGYEEIALPMTVESFYSQYLVESCDFLFYEKGVDQRLLDLADEIGKKVYEIEDIKEHLQIGNFMSEGTQRMVLESLPEYTRAMAISESLWMYDLWCAGDVEAFREAYSAELPDEELTEEEKKYYEDYNYYMVTRRDQIMLEGIENYLASGETVFVAVGAAHVLAEGGLLDLLEDAGYTVTRVEYQ